MRYTASKPPNALAAIVVAGLIVGVLDLSYAIVVYQPHHPIVTPHTIASGILGPPAYEGGVPTAILGVVLHFFIAFSVTAIYYAVSLRVPYLVEHPVTSGIVYGACVYCVMHGLVLPLSNVHHGPIPKIYVITEFVEHWFFVGLPIALTVRYFSTGRRPKNGTTPYSVETRS